MNRLVNIKQLKVFLDKTYPACARFAREWKQAVLKAEDGKVALDLVLKEPVDLKPIRTKATRTPPLATGV
jgi:hypothetical protein